MNLLLKSAIIVDSTSPYNLQKKDVLIKNGVISKIASKIDNLDDFEVLKLKNLHISKGWFDTSVSFGEPGFEERETIKNGLLTASKSGFTKIAINSNTNPVLDTNSDIEFVLNKCINSATKLFPIGSLTKGSDGKDLAELYDMQNSGAIAFGDYNKPITNPNLLKIALQYVQNFDGLVLSFPQNKEIASNGVVNEESNSTKLGLKGIPALAEEMHIARDLAILEYTGGKLHIPTISTENSVKLIKEAKKKGLKVTCSVAAHNLVLTDEELKNFDSNSKVLPPLRTQKDLKALIKGLKEGVIDIITSDHNPIDVEHKKLEFDLAKFGTIGLESLFGSLNSELDLETLISCLSEKPCDLFNIKYSTIKEGEIANITLFNPDFPYNFELKNILSTSKNSIFLGKKMNGKVYGIFANNQLILS